MFKQAATGHTFHGRLFLVISQVGLILLGLAATNAWAQTGQPSQGFVAPIPSPPPPAVIAPTEESAPRGIANDPNLDRSFLLPTAMTQPKGTLTYSNYELVLHGVTYAFTDQIQGSLTLLPPYVQNMPLIGSVALKGQIVNLARFKLALQGSVSFASENNSSGELFGVGAFASFCLVEDCASLASFSTTLLIPNSGGGQLLAYSGSLTQRISPHAKLLLEIASATLKLSNDNFDNVPGFLFNYGIRFHGQSFAADVGFMRPTGDSSTSNDFVMGFPFLNFSYRVN